MRADLVLGFDPAPADPQALAALRDGLRTAIRALVEARVQRFDTLGRAGSVWDGPAGAPIATLLRRYTRLMSALEESLVDCMQAVDSWIDQTAERQAQVAEIVASVADLAGDADADDRRTRLIATARELGDEHDRAAGDLAAVFEELSLTVEQIVRPDDLAAELDRALLALSAAVDDWITAEAPELIRTAMALGEVAGLTTVISELVGIAALGRNPGDAAGVSEIIARSPGSHRLIRALRRQWLEVAPTTLPAATFAFQTSGQLSDAIAGGRSRSSDGGDEAKRGGQSGSGE